MTADPAVSLTKTSGWTQAAITATTDEDGLATIYFKGGAFPLHGEENFDPFARGNTTVTVMRSAAATAPGTSQRRLGLGGRDCEPGAVTVRRGAIASPNCATGLNRSAGVLARQRSNAAVTHPGTEGRIAVTLGGAAERCWCTRLSTVGPVNGGCPASISYKTQPKAQMSVRLSTGFPRACSGLI